MRTLSALRALSCLVLLLVGLSSRPATGQNPQQQLRAVVIPTPADAVQMAAADVLQLPLEDRPFQTYFLTYDRSKEFYGAFNYVLNTSVSHASVLYKPDVVAGGWLIRVDRRRLWPRTEDFVALDAEFQKLGQIEHYFHVQGVIAQEKVEFEEVQVKTGRQIPQQFTQGMRRFTRMVDEVVTERRAVTKGSQPVATGSEFALHLLGKTANEAPIIVLAKATATPGLSLNANPIMRADWFLFIASSTLAEENGRYYEFRRIKDSQGGKTAEQLWLETQGVNYEVIKNLRSDQRIAKWRSNVTGKPRAVEYFFTTAARPSVGPVGVALTRDYLVGKVDSTAHALRNLLNYKFDGTEAMGFLPNGMMSFVLFNGDGSLARTAPDKLVSDRTVPSPHQTLLQAPISCYRCHGTTDMWMDAANDIYSLSKGKFGLNVFDDLSSKTDPLDTLDRLVGLYAGEMDEFLTASRNTHAKSTFILTNGMQIPDVAKKIGEIYGSYRYNPVTPQVACLELGWVVSEEDAIPLLNMVLPVLPKNRNGIHTESVVIGTLRAWTPQRPLFVNRDDWEQEYADAMLRVQTQAVRMQASPQR